MKSAIVVTFLSVLACLGHTNAKAIEQSQEVNLGAALVDYMKALESVMPCGYELLDLPVMAPFTADSIQYNFSNQYRTIKSNFTDLYVTGLDKAEFIKFDYDAENGMIQYDINYPLLQLLGEYELEISALLAGMNAKLNGNGLLNIKIVDLRTVGQMQLAPNADNYLQLSNPEINFYIGDVLINNWNNVWDIALNNYFNSFLKDFILMWTQEIQPEVTQFYKEKVIPIINNGLIGTTEDQLVSLLVQLTNEMKSAKCNANSN